MHCGRSQFRRQNPDAELQPPEEDGTTQAAAAADSTALGQRPVRRSSVIDEVLHGTDSKSVRRGSVALAMPEAPNNPPPQPNMRRSSVIELIKGAEQRRRASITMMDNAAASQATAMPLTPVPRDKRDAPPG